MVLGELAALNAAMSYATSSTLFSLTVKATTPIQLNYLKGLFSIGVITVALLFFADSIFPQDTFRTYFLFILSGIFGIGLGDCFLFQALDYLGPRKTILLETLAPPFTGLISYFYYGTTLSLIGWLGILVTAYGIHMVVNEEQDDMTQELIKDNDNKNVELTAILIQQSNDAELNLPVKNQQSIETQEINLSDKRKELLGMMSGVAFTFCQSFGMVLSHDATSSQKFSSLQSALLRIIAGFMTCVVIMLVKRGESFKWPYKTRYETKLFIYACIIGQIIGIWSQQTSLIYTRPEISQTIIATTPLFGLGIAWYRGEQMKLRYLIGSLIAVAGVVIIVWG